MTNYTKLFGFNFLPRDPDETARIIVSRCRAGDRCAVFTPNSEMLERAVRDPDFARVLSSADILTADGVGVCLASRLLGGGIIPRVCGVELGERLLEIAAEEGLRVFLFGGEPGVAEEAARLLRLRYSRLSVVGTHHGYLPENEMPQLAREIDSCAPDLLFVCLGSPKQEGWIAEYLPRLSHPCAALGLGGSLNVYAGRVARAPAAVRLVGAEWLWRAAIDPRRIPRLVLVFSFAGRVLRAVASKHLRDVASYAKRHVQRAQSATSHAAALGKK